MKATSSMLSLDTTDEKRSKQQVHLLLLKRLVWMPQQQQFHHSWMTAVC